MKMDKISHDAFTTAADAVPHDIIAQQRSAGIPELLISMQVDPAKFAEGAVKPRKMLDGLVIPEGTFTLAALDGASGKSTGVRGAAAFAADTGLWCLLENASMTVRSKWCFFTAKKQQKTSSNRSQRLMGRWRHTAARSGTTASSSSR